LKRKLESNTAQKDKKKKEKNKAKNHTFFKKVAVGD